MTTRPALKEAIAAVQARREHLGRIAHGAWVAWAMAQLKPGPFRQQWEDCTPFTQESFTRIGEAVAAAERERWLSAPLADRIGEAFLKIVDEDEAMDCLEALAALLRGSAP